MVVNLFQPGPDARRTGRTRGAKDKFSAQFLKDFMAEWEVGGKGALRILRIEEPAKFVAIGAAILPKDVFLQDATTELSDEELELLLAEMRERRAKLVEQPKEVPLLTEVKANGRATVTAD